MADDVEVMMLWCCCEREIEFEELPAVLASNIAYVDGNPDFFFSPASQPPFSFTREEVTRTSLNNSCCIATIQLPPGSYSIVRLEFDGKALEDPGPSEQSQTYEVYTMRAWIGNIQDVYYGPILWTAENSTLWGLPGQRITSMPNIAPIVNQVTTLPDYNPANEALVIAMVPLEVSAPDPNRLGRQYAQLSPGIAGNPVLIYSQ